MSLFIIINIESYFFCVVEFFDFDDFVMKFIIISSQNVFDES